MFVYRTVVRDYATEMDLVNVDLKRDVVAGARFGATIATLGDIDGDR